MDCKEFEKLIPNFIEKKLGYPTLKHFYDHMCACPECKEELTIKFLVSEGIHRLEDGSAFDLQAELEQILAGARKEIKTGSNYTNLGISLQLLAGCILAGIFIWMLL